jgi:hypothetical protein
MQDGWTRMAALPEEECPKCGAFNLEATVDKGPRVHIWKVADERGSHFQCKVCAHSWVTPSCVVVTAKDVRI